MDNHSHEESEASPNQELMYKASFIEKHMQELGEKIDYLSHQLSEMEEFNKDLTFLKDAKTKEIFAPLGKGIYLKSSLEDKNLFVNVGAGVIVKKTPEETKKIIESQIKNFHDAKIQLMSQLEVYRSLFNQTLLSLEKPDKDKSK